MQHYSWQDEIHAQHVVKRVTNEGKRTTGLSPAVRDNKAFAAFCRKNIMVNERDWSVIMKCNDPKLIWNVMA